VLAPDEEKFYAKGAKEVEGKIKKMKQRIPLNNSATPFSCFAAVKAGIVVWLLIHGARSFERLYRKLCTRAAKFVTPSTHTETGATS
jgi:hypothetical protein